MESREGKEVALFWGWRGSKRRVPVMWVAHEVSISPKLKTRDVAGEKHKIMDRNVLPPPPSHTLIA